MADRTTDGSAGDVDYAKVGLEYARYRRPDMRIAEVIWESLAGAKTVLNVGAGAGSYEPTDHAVTAVEPSATMRAQRPTELPVAIDGVAEHLPFEDGEFDASMAVFSVHQWKDLRAGLSEMRRVTKQTVVLVTADPAALTRFWLVDYAPEVIDAERDRYPATDELASGLGGDCSIETIAIPLDCIDGFNEAYYGRPEMLLDPAVRRCCSAWTFVSRNVESRFVEHLSADLADGTWNGRYQHLRTQPIFYGSLILFRSTA